MSKKSKANDDAWEALFDDYGILSRIDTEGSFSISADQIKKYREPRLMAKHDHQTDLPGIFRKNKLAILPVTRGDYVISHFKAYHEFEPVSPRIHKAAPPANLQSLDFGKITSEAVAINGALAAGILADFLEEGELCATVSGRMGSGEFDFAITNTRRKGDMRLSVANSQIEIDGGFEGAASLALLEAKRDLSEDFLIRQLYYPFRVWLGKITKQVRPVFMIYTNGIFSLYEYMFADPSHYNSLVLIKHKNYSIEATKIEAGDLLEVLVQTVTVREPEIPFPQADKFERVINICELLYTQEINRDQVTEEYSFDARQTNYYTDAARYLDLVDKRMGENRKPVYFLTERGKRILGLPYKQRQLALCAAILRHKVFHDAFRIVMERGGILEKREIIDLMRQAELYHVHSDNTYERRSSTVRGWLGWMLGLPEAL